MRVHKIQAAGHGAFDNGSVVTWGVLDFGGDSSHVQELLVQVQRIQATDDALAAILEDGSVVTRVSPDCGGDSSQAQEQLVQVQQIQATGYACGPGSVQAGEAAARCREQVVRIHQIQAIGAAFAFVLQWGAPDCGGDSSRIQSQLALKLAQSHLHRVSCTESLTQTKLHSHLRTQLGRVICTESVSQPFT